MKIQILLCLLFWGLATASLTEKRTSRILQALTPTDCYTCVVTSSASWSPMQNKCLLGTQRNGVSPLYASIESCLRNNMTNANAAKIYRKTFNDSNTGVNSTQWTVTINCSTSNDFHLVSLYNQASQTTAQVQTPTGLFSTSSSAQIGLLITNTSAQIVYFNGSQNALSIASGGRADAVFRCITATKQVYSFSFFKNMASTPNKTNTTNTTTNSTTNPPTNTNTTKPSNTTNNTTSNQLDNFAFDIIKYGGALTYTYNSYLSRTCVTTNIPGQSPASFTIPGKYNSTTGIPYSTLQAYASQVQNISTCSGYQSYTSNPPPSSPPSPPMQQTYYSSSSSSYCSYNYFEYSGYYKTKACKEAKSQTGYIIALVIGAFVITFIILLFTHCLKRRKSKLSGKMQWECRKASKRGACLKKRPRSYEKHLERELEKAKFGPGHIPAITIGGGYHDTTMSGLVVQNQTMHTQMNMVTPMPMNMMPPPPIVVMGPPPPQMVMQAPMMMQQPQQMMHPQQMMMPPPQPMMGQFPNQGYPQPVIQYH